MSYLHPDTRKFGARYAVSVHQHIPKDYTEAIRKKLAEDIKAKMVEEGYRPIGAIKQYTESVDDMIEYRAIQLALPRGVER